MNLSISGFCTTTDPKSDQKEECLVCEGLLVTSSGFENFNLLLKINFVTGLNNLKVLKAY